jgi:CMP-N-acetylneuraminic acid synthetase
MIAVIPAKANSIRVPSKNFKPFWGAYSLTDLTISKLIPEIGRSGIYLSCEDADIAAPICHKWGIKFLPREERLTDNNTPIPDWIRGVCGQIANPHNEDFAWCQVIDPLFNDYEGIFNKWELIKREHQGIFESITAVYPVKDYLLDNMYNPIGWSFGDWHTPSQHLPQMYRMTFVCSVLTAKAVERHGYHISSNPYYYHVHTPHIDIDTHDDFCSAQHVYESKFGPGPEEVNYKL